MRSKEQIMGILMQVGVTTIPEFAFEIALDIRDALVDVASAIQEHSSFSNTAVDPQWHLKGQKDES